MRHLTVPVVYVIDGTDNESIYPYNKALLLPPRSLLSSLPPVFR
jgi:hypothetical protein